MFKIPKKIEYVIETLTKNGHEAYIVGGSIRDMMLGKEPFDFDIATSAKPFEVQELFQKTIPTGIKHGTVTVMLEDSGIEVTTFRCDGEYTDNRHPENIEFVSNINEDLARRDFTVNALAYSPAKGVIDFYNGKSDLENKILRAVGEPEKRFCEDALRILRLFRFASVLDFKIEDTTFNAAIKKGYLLKNISSERILPELLKAVTGQNCEVISSLIESNALDFLGITKAPDFSIVKNLRCNIMLAFFAFIYFASNNPIETLNKLKVSNKIKNYFELLLKIIDLNIPETKPEIKRILCTVPPEIFNDFLTYKNVVFKIETNHTHGLLKEILENDEPYLISHLKIDGNYLKSKGYNGTKIGEILCELQQYVIDFPTANTTEDLIVKIDEISS